MTRFRFVILLAVAVGGLGVLAWSRHSRALIVGYRAPVRAVHRVAARVSPDMMAHYGQQAWSGISGRRLQADAVPEGRLREGDTSVVVEQYGGYAVVATKREAGGY